MLSGIAGQLENLDRVLEWRLCYACQGNRRQWALQFFPGDQLAGGGMLTTHSNAVERLKVSVAVLLLTRYTFLAWTGSPVIGQRFFPEQPARLACRVTSHNLAFDAARL